MSNFEKRIEIRNLSKERIKSLRFGDPVTNICAGEKNPYRLCFFVCHNTNKHTVECTDKNGWFGEFDMDVIHSGHLSFEESNKLYEPVWAAEYE